MFENSTLLITGGTGSFGKTILHRFLDTKIKEIRIFSRDEKKQEDLRLKLNNPKLKFYIGDVRDPESLAAATSGVDFVFHAAALKQVPSCEFYPMEAVKTNVIGTNNVVKAAIDAGVKKLVLLSTDKAVYPINAMGVSKSMAEKVLIACARQQPKGGTILCATRYGNVMGSRGSVIPLFIAQIQAKEPLTVTDPNMTRFLMSLEESVDLVLRAFQSGQQGDIFVQKSPATSISNLAEALKIIFNSNSDIKIIGTRHGEKLFESLVSREEMASVEDLGNYYRIPCDNRDLNYAKYFSDGEPLISEFVDYTSHNTKQLSVIETMSLLKKLPFIEGLINA